MRIERIDVYVTDLPERVRRRVATGSRDTGGSETILGKPLLVRIDAEGVVGYGQIRPISPGHSLPDTIFGAVAAIRDFYGPVLIGQRVSEFNTLWEQFDCRLPANSNARAAIDHALHDALGKALGVPVYDLIGGAARPTIPLEWSVSLADEAGPMIEECQRAINKFGVNAFCLKAGSTAGWEEDVRIVIEVREALGDDVEISVDPNTVWPVSDAIRAIRALEPVKISYVEQPVERSDHAGMALIRQASGGVPLMADESITSVRDAYALARTGAADAFCIKLYKVGGITPARKIAAVAEAANIRVNLGGTAIMSQLEVAAGTHFYGSIPQSRAFGGAEFVFGLGVAGKDPLVAEPPYRIVDGSVELVSTPGLGVSIDEDALSRLALVHDSITAA